MKNSNSGLEKASGEISSHSDIGRLQKLIGDNVKLAARIVLPDTLVADALKREGEIQFDGTFVACAGHVPKHTDDIFPPWSAFLTLRNDGCRVWQRCGYNGVPAVGERFVLNIHKTHGVIAKKTSVLVLVCADAESRSGASNSLNAILRRLAARKQPLLLAEK